MYTQKTRSRRWSVPHSGSFRLDSGESKRAHYIHIGHACAWAHTSICISGYLDAEFCDCEFVEVVKFQECPEPARKTPCFIVFKTSVAGSTRAHSPSVAAKRFGLQR